VVIVGEAHQASSFFIDYSKEVADF